MKHKICANNMLGRNLLGTSNVCVKVIKCALEAFNLGVSKQFGSKNILMNNWWNLHVFPCLYICIFNIKQLLKNL